MNMSIRALVAAACVMVCATAAAASPPQKNGAQVGTFALDGGNQKTVAILGQTQQGRSMQVRIEFLPWNGHSVIRHFDADLTKLMHLVVVSADLQTFFHVHPAFDPSSGSFTARIPVSEHERYYAFADAQPSGFGQQVFRFELNPDTSTPAPSQVLPAPVTSAHAGPYTVVLNASHLTARVPQQLDVRILEGAAPAAGLQLYLGVPAHVVLVNAATLSYTHVHPSAYGAAMEMDQTHGMPAMKAPAPSAHLTLHVPALSSGSYRMWIEFQAHGARYVAPFTVQVR